MAHVAIAMAAVASQPRVRHFPGKTKSPMIFGRVAASITATMMGTEITALMTAAQ